MSTLIKSIAFGLSGLVFSQFSFGPALIPTTPTPVETLASAVVPIVSPVVNPIVGPIAQLFFGEAKTAEAQTIVADQMDYVSSRDAYPASLAVIQKYADTIKSEAAQQGVPEDVAIGVALLENGGSETAKSPAGALGVYQLMPYTARSLGLTVTKKQDDRKDPAKSIKAGISYLKENYDRFGDWGLATWAYHAGEGNVAKAVKIYAKAHDGITLAGVSDATQMKNYIASRGLTVYKLLSDANVQKFTDTLHDDSSEYPYKVLATAALFKQANS